MIHHAAYAKAVKKHHSGSSPFILIIGTMPHVSKGFRFYHAFITVVVVPTFYFSEEKQFATRSNTFINQTYIHFYVVNGLQKVTKLF